MAVFFCKAKYPTAVLSVPTVFACNDALPKAVFRTPELARIDAFPMEVLVLSPPPIPMTIPLAVRSYPPKSTGPVAPA